MSENKIITSPLKAIKEKCLDCCCWQRNEVKLCTVVNCSLHPFRFGKNPFRQKKEYSKEELDQLKQRMENARNSKKQ